jgi:hypothetical protein
MEKHLSPTLWRTCRVLANESRLLLIKAMIDQPPMTVKQLACTCKMREFTCSLRLRQIHARGLLTVTRSSKWVSYQLGADPEVEHAKPILVALIKTLRKCQDKEDFSLVIKEATLFTHPRRIMLARALAHEPRSQLGKLLATCDISLPALYRHLDKMERRGLITCSGTEITLSPSQKPFTKALLSIATGRVTRAEHLLTPCKV